MKKTVKDTCVLCDMDNTLLTAKDGIPSCNRAVLELFMKMGGKFTVATGRPHESVRAALEGLPLSMPAICCGGSEIFDFSRNIALSSTCLEETEAKQTISDVMHKFPHVGVEIMTKSGLIYVIRSNLQTYNHLRDEKIEGIMAPATAVPPQWLKVVFAADPSELEKVRRFLKTKFYGHGNVLVATNTIYYEIMPAGVSKASALRELCGIAGMDKQNTVVIGDYYNDIELMQEAGYAVAVANAPLEVQQAAAEVTGATCTQGAVGEFLYRLIREDK